MIFKEVPTSASRVQLLHGGAVDIAQYLQPLEIISMKSVPTVAVETVPASFMIWVELNAKIPPFDNVDVRRAMNFAFPQQEVIKAVYQDLANPLDGCMPNIYPGFSPDFYSYSYDLDKAKQLLDKAGQGNGFKTTLAYNAGDPVQEPIAIIYQIGAAQDRRRARAEEGTGRLVLQLRHRAQAADDLLRRQPLVPRSRLFADALLRQQELCELQQLCQRRGGQAARRDGGHSATKRSRLEEAKQAQKIIMDEAPWTFVAYPNYTMARKADLKGWTYYTSNNIRFQDFSRA